MGICMKRIGTKISNSRQIPEGVPVQVQGCTGTGQ